MKKIFTKTLVALLLAFTVLPVFTNEAKAATKISNGFEYTVKGKNVTIIGYTGKKKSLTIPKTIKGKKVTVIGQGAFQSN